MDPITLSLILGLGGYIGARVLGGIAESATGSNGFGKFCKYTADIGLFVYMTVTLAGVPLVGAASSKILEWLAPTAVTSLWSIGKFVGATAIGGCLASIIKWKSGHTSEEAGKGFGDAISGLYHKVKEKIQHKLEKHKLDEHKLEKQDDHKLEQKALLDDQDDESSQNLEKAIVKYDPKQALINLKALLESKDSGYESDSDHDSSDKTPLINNTVDHKTKSKITVSDNKNINNKSSKNLHHDSNKDAELHADIKEMVSKYIADGTISKHEAIKYLGHDAVLNIASEAIQDHETSKKLYKLGTKHPEYVVADVLKGITKDAIPESVLFAIGENIVQPALDVKAKYVWDPLQEKVKDKPALSKVVKFFKKLDVHPFGNKKAYDEYTKQKAELTEQNPELSKALKEGGDLLTSKLTSGQFVSNDHKEVINHASSNRSKEQESDTSNLNDALNHFVTDDNREQVLSNVKKYLTEITSTNPSLKDVVDLYLDSLQSLSNQELGQKIISDYKIFQSSMQRQEENELTSYMSCRQEVSREDMDLEGIDDEVQSHEIVG